MEVKPLVELESIAFDRHRLVQPDADRSYVWDVDVLKDEVIRCYRSDDPNNPTVFHRSETANAEPALPGWSMPVDVLFE